MKKASTALIILTAIITHPLNIYGHNKPEPNVTETWEYKVRVIDKNENIETALNALGAQGWELVTVIDTPANQRNPIKLYLKRSK